VSMENITGTSEISVIEEKNKLWNLNFILLWQGQLVSSFGDSVYDIALGFWILSRTGSTAIMGILMAMTVAPRIFLSPIAGTFADRHNRKWIMVLTDGLRGVTITFIGVAAIFDFIEIWMVMLGGIILGICGSLFNPAVQSSLPDIISKDKLVKGNSAISLANTGMDILGKSMGGVLYQFIGAPVLFLTNGISFILSAISELFIKIPVTQKASKKIDFMDDLKAGFKYVKDYTGLKYLYVTIAFLNFFAVMSLTLLLPFFNSKEYLGPEKYGVAMAFSAAGMFAGFFLFTVVDINRIKKSVLFSVGGMITCFCIGVLPLMKSYTLIIILLLVNGVAVAVVRTILQASLQAAVPSDMLGKVFGFRRAIASSLIPLAMAVGGLMAEFIPIGLIISGGNIVIFILFLVLGFNKPVIELVDAY